MRKEQQLAGRQVRPDFFGVDLGRGLVGDQNHHHIGPLGGLGNRGHFKPGLLRLGNGFGVGRQATFTWTPESFRLRAWACPWEP